MKPQSIVVLGIAVLGIAQGANAQETVQPGSKAVWRNAKGGAVAARRPGLMVQQGLQRFRNAQNEIIDRARRGPDITDTPADRPTSAIVQAKAKIIEVIFDNLTVLLLAINAQQRIEAGLPPVNAVPDGGVTTTPDLSALLGDIRGPSG